MNCPYCNYPNEKDSRFCENCGAPLPAKQPRNHTGLIIAITVVILAAICGITAILLFNPGSEKKTAAETLPEETSSAEISSSENASSLFSASKTKAPETVPEQSESETVPSSQSTVGTIPTTEAPAAVTATLANGIPSGLSSCVKVSASNASASSTIIQSGYDNSALCLVDGKDETSWQEGVSGSGLGEYAEIQYTDSSNIKYIAFKLGNWRDDDYFYGNNRPKTLTLTFDGNESYTVTFPSEKSVYYLEFSSPVTASHLRITIDEVYPGLNWDDTCIAEITAYSQN